MYRMGRIGFFNFFLSQTILNASAGSGGNNQAIGMGGLILKFAKLVSMVADEYMGVAVFPRVDYHR